MAEATLGEIAAHLGGELIGDAGLRITRIGPLEGATPSTISFLSNPRYQAQLALSQAGCVIVGPSMRDAAMARGAALIAADPYASFARLTQWWVGRSRPAAQPGIHSSAVIDASASIDPSASIGPLVVVEALATVGEGAVIGSHCVIGRGSSVGRGTRLAAHVTLYAGCHIGDRGIVHSGVVIGADGFGFAPTAAGYEKIEQLGGVRIGHDVEIGANTCIDRGALEDTVLEDGVKLDNLVQIAHGVRVGAHTVLSGCVGVAGSAKIGARCAVGGGAVILGHLSLADGVVISAASVVTRSILKPGQYSGVFPIDDNASWEKNAATLRNLHALRARLLALEKKTN
ncbi:MAG: UDP-3-O-(3-hydroxymyristoyl)glucosamine N-acyltransferase [Cytophagales bacterium]|nr:UDP-3-O-(3-hydroxymyristoyl)glucosamine N-acyltransferase [Rhizobacter sp.]